MGSTLLIVDDNTSVTSVLKTIFSIKYPDLEITSFSTKSAGHGAMEWLKENRPDYAIIDLVINGISGIDIYKRILDADMGTAVVFLTGCSDDDVRLAGVRDFPEVTLLRKVASIESIARALRLGS